jgi:flagellar biosynthetic protein FliR
MEPGALAILASFYDSIDVFLLIFVRVLGFFLLLPVVSANNIPMQIRLMLAFCLSITVYTSGAVNIVPFNDTIISYFGLILTEFFTGVLLGYILYFTFTIILYTGRIIDYNIGFSMVNILDPITQIQVPVTGNLLFLAIMALLAATGGLHSFVGAFFYSYNILPIGISQIVGNAPLAWHMMTLLTSFVLLGVRIALPIIGAMMVINVTLGIMVKAVPQMNVFVVGMPIKVLVGLFLIFAVLSPSLWIIYNNLFDKAINEMVNITWGLLP